MIFQRQQKARLKNATIFIPSFTNNVLYQEFETPYVIGSTQAPEWWSVEGPAVLLQTVESLSKSYEVSMRLRPPFLLVHDCH